MACHNVLSVPLSLSQYLIILLQIYNIVDEATSTQGTISDLLGQIFNIKVFYCGNLVSNLLDLSNITDDANDKHLELWAEVCRQDKVVNTPLSPHLHSELLLKKHLNLDGNKLRALGFKISVPQPSEENVKEIVKDYMDMKVFPQTLAP